VISEKHRKRTWLVVDRDAKVHARICSVPLPTAKQIAQRAFPEIEPVALVPTRMAPHGLRIAARGVPELTEEACIKHGIISPVGYWADKLQARFARAGGAR
jgi:hypothetical protein